MRLLTLDDLVLDNINCLCLGLEEGNLHVILVYEDKSKVKVDFETEEEMIHFVKYMKKRECSL